jgi:integrase
MTECSDIAPGMFQRGDNGLWVGTVNLPDDGSGRRRYRQVSAMDYDAAVAKLAKLRADVEAGRVGAAVHYTVAEWLDYWCETIHAEAVRPGTLRNYRGIAANHISVHIGRRRLDRLTAADVRRMHRGIDSSCTAVAAHRILRRALDDAVREGVLATNPARVVHEPRHTTTARAALTAAQAGALLTHCRDTGDPWLLRWACAFLLGARQGEILGIRWSHINLDAARIDLEWQLQAMPQRHGCGPRRDDGRWPCRYRRPRYCPQAVIDAHRGFDYRLLHDNLALTRPKTKSGIRVVPICAPLHDLLTAAHTANRPDRNPHNLLFHHADGRPLTAAQDSRHWHTTLTAAGLPPVTLHSARATAATTLAAAGVDEATRMKILGHVSATVHRGYALIDDTRLQTAMTNLNPLLARTEPEGHHR